MKKKLRGLSRVLLALILVFTMLAHPFGAFAMETAKNSGAPENAAQREAGLQEDQDLTAPSDGEAEDETADPELTPVDTEPTEDEAQEELDPAAPAEEGEAEDETADPELTPVDTEPTEDEAQEELDPAAPAGEGEAESEPAPEEAEATEDSSQEKPDLNVTSDNRQGENYAAAVEQDGNVTYFDSFNAAADGANWVAGSTLRLMTDVTTSSTISVPAGEHTLDLNGHGLIKTGGGQVLRIGSGVTLNIRDSGADTEHRFTVSDPAPNGAGLAMVNDALTSGYKTFTGGYITGGSSSDGGGIAISGTMNLYGGNIIGHQATSSDGNGGAIKIENSSANFNMYGGSVQYNFGRTGGAIFIEGGTFTMEGGSVSHNRSAVRAGAIFDRGHMNLRGGEIAENYTSYENGVINLWGGTIEITGGSIRENVSTAGKRAGIVFTDGLSLGGDPAIYDNKDTNGDLGNFYLNDNGYIKMVGALGDSVKSHPIGVLLNTGKGEFTKGWASVMDMDADPADYFFSQNAEYELLRIRGEGRLVKEPYTLISFAGGEASGKMELDILEDGATQFMLPTESTFTAPAGRTLVGWKLGSTTYAPGETVTLGDDDVTFTAQWTDGVTVIFDAKGGSGVAEAKCILPNTAVENPGKPKKDGYTFLYWTLDGAEYDFSTPVTGDITLVALWAQGVGVGVDFEDGKLPEGWTQTGDYSWGVATGDASGGSGNGQSAKNALAQKNGYGGEAWLMMPEMDLSGVVSAPLRFAYSNRDWSGDTDVLGLYYRVSGGDWQEIFSTDSPHSWTDWIGELPAEALTAHVQIGFKASSNYGYGVGLDDILLEAITPHEHAWTYTADGSTITATCPGMADGTCLLEPQTLTISAEGKDFDNTPVEATLTKSADWDACGLETPAEITYSGNTEPGTFTASVTVGDATASVEFTIVGQAAAQIILADESFTDYYDLPAALSAWTTGSTLRLMTDVTTSSTISVSSGEHTLDLNGHGIKMTGWGSVFYVGDGAKLIIDDSDTETTHKFDVPNGAGLASLNEAGGNYTVNGGYITGGNAENGGGIYIGEYGEVVMNGGTLIGSHADDMGAGVRMESNTFFTLNGGEIAYNQSSVHGGGICAAYTNHTVITVNGGAIHHNLCQYSSGAITLDSDPDSYLYLYGGEIRDNASVSGSGNNPWHPGGIAGNGNVHVKGGVQVYNNINLSSSNNGTEQHNIEINTSENDLITLDGPLSKGARIAVSYHTGGNKSTGVFTSGWSKYMGDADPADYFVSDYDEYIVSLNNGEAEIALPPVASVTNGESTENYSSISDAVNAWTAGSTLKLLDDVTTGSTVNVPSGEHTLDLNGHGILMTGSDRVITINQNASLELNDSDPDRIHYITLTDYRGTAVSDSGEASVSGGSGVIQVTGGYLTGGYRNNSGSHDKCGAGVFNWGTFVMNGGSIVGNTLLNNSGAGIRNSGYFTMNGGTIAFNKATGNGGGVTTYVPGGGQGKMTMNGGVISDNCCGSYGGGIQLAGPFEMTGGTVTRNTAGAGGSGVYYGGQGDRFRLSGNPVIKDNTNDDLYLNTGATFLISASLTEDAEIGITMGQNAVFTVGWKDVMGDADPSDYFSSNNADYVAALDDSGEACLRYPDVPDVAAEAFTGSYDGAAHGITVNVPNGATVKYGTEEGSYTLTDSPTYTEAGTYTVYYEVSKEKYSSVHGSAQVEILPKEVTVAVAGHTAAADYDGNVHEVSGYDVTAISEAMYSEADFTFQGTAKASRTDAGTSYMELTAEQFENTNGNFTVTFEITDGYQRIDPISVGVAIVGYNSTSDYNGKAHSVSGYAAAFSTPLYTESDFTFNGTAKAERTDAGTTVMGLTPDQFENINSNFKNVTFTVVDGYVTVDPIDVTVTITGHNDTADYDGETHSVEGYDAKADSKLYDVSQDFIYNGSAEAVRTDAGTTEMGLTAEGFENTNSNFATVTFEVTDGWLTVNPIDVTVTITGHNSAIDYDGQAHVVEGYDAVASSDLYDVTKDFTFSGTAKAERTDAGTTDMGLAAAQFENTNGNFANVTFQVTDGWLTVNPIDVTVTITGHNSAIDYDGQTHVAEGYDAVASSDLYDVTKDFTFSGTAKAERTDAGTTDMGLAAAQFENTNGNFKTVTFEVTDGWLTVNPIDVTVTITGHTATVDYNGTVHSVEGYDAVASLELYDVTKDFTFSGKAEASRTDAGKTDMGLTADQFQNTNANFATVTFEVTDGYILVGPIDAIVTITGHTGTFDYDGELHTVEGYDVSCDNPLYLESDFSFSGTAKAETTDAGTVMMGLADSQFENTNSNFATVVFFVTDGSITVDPIDVTVTITGQNDTVDYDGETHSVEGYDAVASSALYDVTKDFKFSGTAKANRTDVGTSKMGLAAEQFTNKNKNFATVTFTVTDGFVTVNPLAVTVTITGHTDTVNYDGKAHVVEGYDVAFSDPLYTKADFAFSGAAMAQRANAGTTKMGLAAEQFANINNNFGTVIFRVTDGYLTVKPVNAVITTQPQAKSGLICNDTEQELILAGSATGGTLYYAIGESAGAAPANDQYTTKLPVGKDTGIYYIWYKVKADANHNDLPPVCLKVTMAGEDWVTVNGGIVDEDGNPVSEATVSLILGGSVVDETVTGSDGAYSFTVPEGVYNVVVVCEDATVTDLVDAAESTPYLVTVPDSDTDSVLDVAGTDSNIVVGGLSDEASRIRELEEVPNDQNVTVKMTVTTVTESETANAAAIGESDPDKNFLFYDLKLEKTVDAVTTNLAATQTVLEIVIPCAFTDKSEFCVYSSGAGIQALTESDSRAAGTYRVDRERGVVYIYTNSITTYAVGYKPYYSVTGNVSLGSYTGTVSVTLTRDGTGETYVLNNVTLENISFTGIPKGTYSMTVTWTDGVENTITTPFTIKEMTGGPNNE